MPLPISNELEAQILEYYGTGDWTVNQIARQLRVHHGTVKRVLIRSGGCTPEELRYVSQFDRFWPTIVNILRKAPSLPASEVYRRVSKFGFKGGLDHFRYLMSQRRPAFSATNWLVAVLQNKISEDELREQLDNFAGLNILLQNLYRGPLNERNKSMAILGWKRGLTS